MEGRAVLEQAIGELEREGTEADLAEACYLAIRASEEDGDLPSARAWASRAEELFKEQQRPGWELLARYRGQRAALADLSRLGSDG